MVFLLIIIIFFHVNVVEAIPTFTKMIKRYYFDYIVILKCILILRMYQINCFYFFKIVQIVLVYSNSILQFSFVILLIFHFFLLQVNIIFIYIFLSFAFLNFDLLVRIEILLSKKSKELSVRFYHQRTFILSLNRKNKLKFPINRIIPFFILRIIV